MVCKEEAERWRSPAAGSRSDAGAEAGGSQVQRQRSALSVVRLSLESQGYYDSVKDDVSFCVKANEFREGNIGASRMGCVMTVSDYIVKECLCTLVLTQFLAKVLPAIFAKTSQETCNFTGL